MLLEQTSINVTEIDPDTENSYIHLACRNSLDIVILESLLIAVRTALVTKEKLVEFLDLQNNDGFRAIDFCRVKSRHDMAVILESFVETSQQIVQIPDYYIEIDHEFCPEKITSNEEFQSILQNEQHNKQYNIVPFLSTIKGFNF